MTESSSQANIMLLLTSPIDWDAINVTLRFLGIVKNSEMTKPLHDQLAKNIFQWGTQQSRAFGAIKEAIVRGPILIGVCRCVITITVEAGGGLQPEVCVYRSNRRTTLCSNREGGIRSDVGLSDYLLGLKPLVSLFSRKLLDKLPVRVQQFRMR